MYAQVLVFIPLKVKDALILDYDIPAALASAVRPGVLVVAPLREQLLPGIVLALTETSAVPKTRPIQSVLYPDPALDARLLDLARWIARETLAPLHQCVQVMLPPGLRTTVYLRLTPLVISAPPDLPAPAKTLLETLIQRGALTSAQAKQAVKGVDLRRARYYLKRRGLIKVERLLRLAVVQPKVVQFVRLTAPRAQWEAQWQGLRNLALYRRILEFLENERQPVDVSVVYAETGAQYTHLKTLTARGLVAFSHEEVLRDPLAEMIFTPDAPPALISEQQSAWDVIETLLREATSATAPAPALLLGVTGSGKTELYMRATAHVLAQGKQALILVPEISLTPQTVQRFAVRFPGQVGLWHSGMSDGERFDTWRRVRSGAVTVVVGARSALFAPFPNLGLIVMDEEEDTSYKQGRPPYYHTRDVAEELARMTGALLILGSATPSLEAYARALAGRYRLLEMPQRVMGHRQRIAAWEDYLHLPGSRYQPLGGTSQAAAIALPPVQIVDMRAELKAGNRSVFSVVLQEAVDRALAQHEQVILFLNRRGTATYIFCRDCGWTAECPRCDAPLTYHEGASLLLCHRCGHQKRMPRQCPACGSLRVRAFGLGTEGLEARVTERWPDASLVRWDQDTARSHAAHTAIMGRFARGEADILVGTQMVARGLDIPKVTVVGIISADTALNLPDFRAAERAFQLLAQVAGRSGRGLLGGRVILQTYYPTHYAVQRAAVHDYTGFAQRELAFREQADYPPFIRLARLVYAHADREHAQQAAESFAATLRDALRAGGLPTTDLIGPAPAFFARVRGRYRWQILLRSVAPADFLRQIALPAGWLVDIDPVDVL
ncbi:MAG TPA: primosomal protein N' [Anaerolineae bacterium]|nr:primosomal protein N' [Anaerolineae bacterium]HQI85255.1 primosomal protein N' [Anaerolineae bacterium]